MKHNELQKHLKQYENEVHIVNSKIYEVKTKYYLEKLFAKGFFIDEYKKFKDRTGKILVATYKGGSSMNKNNYSFKIVDAYCELSAFDKEFADYAPQSPHRLTVLFPLKNLPHVVYF